MSASEKLKALERAVYVDFPVPTRTDYRRQRGAENAFLAALPQIVAVVEAAETQAHEHPDTSWGYDAAGIHAYESNEPDGTDYAKWVATCPTCAALAALDEALP